MVALVVLRLTGLASKSLLAKTSAVAQHESLSVIVTYHVAKCILDMLTAQTCQKILVFLERHMYRIQ